MADNLSNVRKSLKSNVHSEEYGRKLARIASAALAPKAARTEKRLEDSFRAIAVARKYRGHSKKARENAVTTLDEEIRKSGKATEEQNARDEPSGGS